MSDITIQGLTPLQQDLADRLWGLSDREEIGEFLLSLPKNLRREAVAVAHMIVAAHLDNYMEVSDDVKNYCSSL